VEGSSVLLRQKQRRERKGGRRPRKGWKKFVPDSRQLNRDKYELNKSGVYISLEQHTCKGRNIKKKSRSRRRSSHDATSSSLSFVSSKIRIRGLSFRSPCSFAAVSPLCRHISVKRARLRIFFASGGETRSEQRETFFILTVLSRKSSSVCRW